MMLLPGARGATGVVTTTLRTEVGEAGVDNTEGVGAEGATIGVDDTEEEVVADGVCGRGGTDEQETDEVGEEEVKTWGREATTLRACRSAAESLPPRKAGARGRIGCDARFRSKDVKQRMFRPHSTRSAPVSVENNSLAVRNSVARAFDTISELSKNKLRSV